MSTRKRKRSGKLVLATELERKAPHIFMNPMMTEYDYVVMRGAAIAPHVENNVKLARLILEFVLPCGIPLEHFCSWKDYPQFRVNWNYDFEWLEHFKVHGQHACVVYADQSVVDAKRGKDKKQRKKRVFKGTYVYQ